jgi:thioredoxin-like negative regulator of GroEL
MKNLTFTLLLTLIAILGFGQAQRVVLLEHFTQASCGPCATLNPAVQTLINANQGKIITIK